MFVTNTETVPGAKIARMLGMVQGNTVRAKHLGKDLLAGFKSMAGGELHQYTELMTEARTDAMNRMIAQAQQMGANAVINVRFSTASVAAGAAELYAYGTAVVLEQQ